MKIGPNSERISSFHVSNKSLIRTNSDLAVKRPQVGMHWMGMRNYLSPSPLVHQEFFFLV